MFSLKKLVMYREILLLGLFHLIGSPVAAKDCGLPGIPSNGLLNGTAKWNETRFPPGSRVHFTCPRPDQLLMDGNEFRSCKEDGTWTGTLPWCATNVIYHQPVLLNVTTFGRPVVKTLRGLTDGIESDSCVMVSGDDEHAFTFHLSKKHLLTALRIHTEDLFPVERNHFRISSSAKWPYRISSRVTSPSIVLRGPVFQNGNQFTVVVKSERSFSVCELQLLAQTGRLECGEPERPADGRTSVKVRGGRKQVQYRCRKGYQLDGPSVRSCNGTRWDGVQPTCVPITDPNHQDIGRVNGTEVECLTSSQMTLTYMQLVERFVTDLKRKMAYLVMFTVLGTSALTLSFVLVLISKFVR